MNHHMANHHDEIDCCVQKTYFLMDWVRFYLTNIKDLTP